MSQSLLSFETFESKHWSGDIVSGPQLAGFEQVTLRITVFPAATVKFAVCIESIEPQLSGFRLSLSRTHKFQHCLDLLDGAHFATQYIVCKQSPRAQYTMALRMGMNWKNSTIWDTLLRRTVPIQNNRA